MAGSGMATGGRVRHHLKYNLWRQDSSIVFVGYAASGSLARQIINGADHVHLFGEEIPVNAGIHTINGFSAHADQAELLAWHRQTGAERTFLVHGEQETMQSFGAAQEHPRGNAGASPGIRAVARSPTVGMISRVWREAGRRAILSANHRAGCWPAQPVRRRRCKFCSTTSITSSRSSST